MTVSVSSGCSLFHHYHTAVKLSLVGRRAVSAHGCGAAGSGAAAAHTAAAGLADVLYFFN